MEQETHNPATTTLPLGLSELRSKKLTLLCILVMFICIIAGQIGVVHYLNAPSKMTPSKVSGPVLSTGPIEQPPNQEIPSRPELQP
jgi:hypothetical protein